MEFENDNQIVEETVIEQTNETSKINTQQVDLNENPETIQDEEFDIIKYNKEEVKIPVSERQSYLQKGYHFDTVKQHNEELKQQNAYLDRVAKASGYSNRDEFLKAFEEAERQQQIQQEAQKLGIDEQAYRQHFEPVNEEVQQLKSELQNLKQKEANRFVESELNTLKNKYDDFGKYEKEIFNLAIEKKYSLEDAYKLLTYENRMQNVARQKEQEVLARVTSRDEKQVLSSNDKPNNTKFEPSSMSYADIEKISERVRRGERITF